MEGGRNMMEGGRDVGGGWDGGEEGRKGRRDGGTKGGRRRRGRESERERERARESKCLCMSEWAPLTTLAHAFTPALLSPEPRAPVRDGGGHGKSLPAYANSEQTAHVSLPEHLSLEDPRRGVEVAARL